MRQRIGLVLVCLAVMVSLARPAGIAAQTPGAKDLKKAAE